MLNSRVRTKGEVKPIVCSHCHIKLLYVMVKNEFYCRRCGLSYLRLGPDGQPLGPGINEVVTPEDIKKIREEEGVPGWGRALPILASPSRREPVYPPAKKVVFRLKERPRNEDKTRSK